MKKIWKFLYIFLPLLFFTCSALFSYTNIPIRFDKGEVLKYDIKVINIKVAEQRSIIKDIITLSNREVYYIHTTIKTTPIIDKIYKLRNIIETYIDTKTFLPVLIKTKIIESKWNNDILIKIDNKNQKVFYSDKKYNGTVEFKKHYFGLVSILYFMRSLKLSPGKILEFSIHNKRKIQNIKTLATGIKKTYYIPSLNKKVICRKYEGIENNEANIWITEDKYRIPYKFSSIRIRIAGHGYITFINELKYYSKGR